MHHKQLLDQLEHYHASTLITPEEKPFVEQFQTFVANNQDCFERSCKGHITGSSWIINHDGSAALLTHHRKLNRWLQLGGHADGDTNIAAVALKEAEEESGIETFKLVVPTIFDIDIHPMPGKCHTHYDIRFLLQAPKGALYKVSNESHDLAWIDHDKLSEYTKEPSVLRMAKKISCLFP